MSQRIAHLHQHLSVQPTALTVNTLEDAAKMDGVRLTMIPGIYAVVVEYIRYCLHVRGVDYSLAAHPREDQSFLYELTSQTSVPTLLVNDERPHNTWLEQTGLVNSLGSGPSLIPANSADRATMLVSFSSKS